MSNCGPRTLLSIDLAVVVNQVSENGRLLVFLLIDAVAPCIEEKCITPFQWGHLLAFSKAAQCSNGSFCLDQVLIGFFILTKRGVLSSRDSDVFVSLDLILSLLQDFYAACRIGPTTIISLKHVTIRRCSDAGRQLGATTRINDSSIRLGSCSVYLLRLHDPLLSVIVKLHGSRVL